MYIYIYIHTFTYATGTHNWEHGRRSRCILHRMNHIRGNIHSQWGAWPQVHTLISAMYIASYEYIHIHIRGNIHSQLGAWPQVQALISAVCTRALSFPAILSAAA